MRLDIVSTFPEMFDAVLDYGIVSRALDRKLIDVSFWNPRDYTEDAHRSVDDRPYGGGPGMVMRPAPMVRAIRAAKKAAGTTGATKTVYLTPQGRQLNQASVARMVELDGLILVAGRYEGIDERIIDLEVDEEWSIGDYVLAGGELPAMVLIDALVRLIPGALGNSESAAADSFGNRYAGLLDCAHYTRPPIFEGRAVPAVLLRGDHEKIRQWRQEDSEQRTRERRPDLIGLAGAGEEPASDESADDSFAESSADSSLDAK